MGYSDFIFLFFLFFLGVMLGYYNTRFKFLVRKNNKILILLFSTVLDVKYIPLNFRVVAI